MEYGEWGSMRVAQESIRDSSNCWNEMYYFLRGDRFQQVAFPSYSHFLLYIWFNNSNIGVAAFIKESYANCYNQVFYIYKFKQTSHEISKVDTIFSFVYRLETWGLWKLGNSPSL